MKYKAKKYLKALESLFVPTRDKIDEFIESEPDAREAYFYLTKMLISYNINVNHLYYYNTHEYVVKDGYYRTEYEDKEELVEYEPGYMEEFGNYPKYKKIYTRVPVKRYVDNSKRYKEGEYKVKKIEVNKSLWSFDFYCKGIYTVRKSFSVENFTPLFIKTTGDGYTIFSSDEIEID